MLKQRFFETLREKYPNMEFFLVRTFFRENNDQKKLRNWTLFTQCFRGIESNQWHEMV